MSKTRFLILILSVSALLLAAIFLVSRVRAQGDFTAELAGRLEAQGVPVKSVIVVSRLPFAVEITLQSASMTDRELVEENIYVMLIMRDTTMASRLTLPLEKFYIKFINERGESIYEMSKSIQSERFTQVQIPPTPQTLDIEQATAYVAGQMDLDHLTGIEVKKLEVSTVDIPGGQGQQLIVQVAASDLSQTNQDLRRVFERAIVPMTGGTLGPPDPNINFSLVHFQVLDEQGNAVFDLVADNEGGGVRISQSATGSSSGWLMNYTSRAGSGPISLDSPTPPTVDAYP